MLDLKERTKAFALDIAKLVDGLPPRKSTNVIANQLMRSASSVGANFRAAQRARSPEEFLSKLAIVLEESDESVYWLELLAELQTADRPKIETLLKEAGELTAITVTSIKTKRANIQAAKS